MGHAMLPKHVSKRAKVALQYRRRISGTKEYFYRSMRCKQSSPPSAIQREAAELTAQYEAELRYRQAAHPDAIAEADLDRIVGNYIKRLERNAGDFYSKHVTKEQAFHAALAAEETVKLDDFIDDLRQRGREGVGLEDLPPTKRPAQLTPWTAHEEKEFAVKQRAAKALRKPRRRPPRYLSQVMEWYAVNRDGKAP